VVEGSSLENCRRCEPFVSSNLTASAKHTELKPHELGLFFVSSNRSQKVDRTGSRLAEVRGEYKPLPRNHWLPSAQPLILGQTNTLHLHRIDQVRR
jgi:hypothetical protein